MKEIVTRKEVFRRDESMNSNLANNEARLKIQLAVIVVFHIYVT